MLRKIPFVLLALFFSSALKAQSGWFPFTLPWEDSSRTAIDASDLLVDYPGQPSASVIDARGFLRASPDGHFYWEKTRKRARFWGVNFTFNAGFPPSPDEPLRAGEFPDQHASEKIARRLAKLGVNVIRFHHMDTDGSPTGIWDRNYFPGDTQHIDARQLKRLDYLIYQLRQNGIYANLNLKVGRRFGPNDGVEFTSLFKDPISFFQGVCHFNQRMIDLQRDYARQLLSHRNPYTGKTYAEDPVVAFVEIANEDSLYGNMLNDGGLNYLPGISGALPEKYSLELDALWNTWLARKYASRDSLETAWKSNETAGDTSNRIRNWSFDNGMSDWWLNRIGSANASAAVENGSGVDGGPALKILVVSDNINWHVQLIQDGHAIEKDKAYEFSFYARASTPGEITIDVMKGADPWNSYGLSKTVQLATGWQQFIGRFRANATDPSTVRPTFELGAGSNTIWIDKVEFRATVPKGLEADESFTAGNVRRPIRSNLGAYTPQRIADLFRFYAAVDEDYFTGMRRFLREDLGIRALVTGTAPWWGYLGDVAVQSRMDFVDGHYYWDHPWWPPGQAWQPTGWQINNRPWINQLDEFGGLASQAVEGKPFTVSEFNEVFPNRYALEGPLLAALIANLQDWDAFYMFDYAGSAADYAALYTSSFFSQSGNPIKSAQLPICSRIFLGRQSAVASAGIKPELNRDDLSGGYAKGLVNASAFLESKGFDRRTFLKERLRISGFDRSEPGPLDHLLPAGSVASRNGELLWNIDNPQAAYMRVQASAIQGAIGFIKIGDVNLGDWSFKVGDTGPDHMAVLLQSRDGVSLRETRRMILSVWTEHQNTGMTWNSSGTSVDNRWGSAPTIVRPAQVVLNFRFAGARTLRLFPMDEKGNRKGPLTGTLVDNAYRIQVDTGRDRTVWYELELNDAAPTLDFTTPAPGLSQLYTDAGSDQMQLGWMEVANMAGPGLRSNALLEYSTRGVLTSLVRMPASSAKTVVRAPVVRNTQVDTAMALLNRQPGSSEISMRILDSTGQPLSDPKKAPLSPGQSAAFFVNEKFDLGTDFVGSIELTSNQPFYALTLRSITNAAGDFSLTPYPPESTSSGPLYFAHLVADPSTSTEILLWNSGSQTIKARLEFFTTLGQPTVAADQPPSAEISLDPGQLKLVPLSRTSASFYGYASLTLLAGSMLPSNTAVITRWENGSPASEAGIPATQSVPDDLFLLAERPSQRTALALLNPSTSPAIVELELIGAEGSIPAPNTLSLNLNPGEKRAFFLYEVFPNMPSYATGMVRVRSGTGIATLALVGVTNQRSEFLIASITGEPGQGGIAAGDSAVLPRIAAGAGYRTCLYLLPKSEGSAFSRVQIRFTSEQGISLPLLFR